MRWLPALALGACAVAAATTAGAEEPASFVVVANPGSITKISTADLRRIFLGRKTMLSANRLKVSPSLLRSPNPATQGFIEQVIRKSPSRFSAYWKRRLFSGGGVPPKAFATGQELLDFVSSTPGAIGVVPSTSADSRVSVLVVSK